MITITNTKEMKKYYNEETNKYVFDDNVEFVVGVSVDSNITAYSINACGINARNIKAYNINAYNIKARDIKACNINAWNIKARDINAYDINACDINAWNIKACDINAYDINACDIEAYDINASRNINARNISYHAVCCAYNNITCETIKGRRENAKHFCLDGEITIKGESKYEK